MKQLLVSVAMLLIGVAGICWSAVDAPVALSQENQEALLGADGWCCGLAVLSCRNFNNNISTACSAPPDCSGDCIESCVEGSEAGYKCRMGQTTSCASEPLTDCGLQKIGECDYGPYQWCSCVSVTTGTEKCDRISVCDDPDYSCTPPPGS